MELLVISAMQYSFADEKDKTRQIQGMKINAIPMGSVPAQTSDRVGIEVLELAATDRSVWDGLKAGKVPGIYSAETTIKPKKGVATVVVAKLTFKSEVTLA